MMFPQNLKKFKFGRKTTTRKQFYANFLCFSNTSINTLREQNKKKSEFLASIHEGKIELISQRSAYFKYSRFCKYVFTRRKVSAMRHRN